MTSPTESNGEKAMQTVKISELTDPHEIIVAAANKFDLLAQLEELQDHPESKGNAAIHRRYSQALRSTLTRDVGESQTDSDTAPCSNPYA